VNRGGGSVVNRGGGLVVNSLYFLVVNSLRGGVNYELIGGGSRIWGGGGGKPVARVQGGAFPPSLVLRCLDKRTPGQRWPICLQSRSEVVGGFDIRLVVVVDHLCS
jgi:hypothetical protein